MKPSKRLGAFLALNLSLVPTVLAASNCDQLSGSVYTGYNGFKFDILCDTSTINGNIFAYYSNGDEFQDCVDRCDSVPICAVALYLAGSGDCALINTYQGTRSFNGNDVAMKRPPESATTTSAEFTSSEASSTEVQSTSTEDLTTETSSIEATTTVVSSTEVSSAEEVSSTEVLTTEDPSTMISSIETTSSEATSAEDSATETSTIEATSSEPSSTETSSIETSSAEATSTTTSAATTSTSSEASSESASTSQDYTLVTTTTDSPYTSTTSIETSTDDCDDETSSIETSTVGPTTLPTDSLSSPATTIQTSELSTLASSEASAPTSEASSSTTAETQAETQNSVSTSLPSSNTVTETHTTYTQHGSKTLSASGVTTMKTNSASGLATPYPTSDCVWTVYLTMVEYVTCSTGVVPETAITTTYVTADGHGGNYRPPVVTLPSGCIGGYQVDASGHSYPVAQPTKGSYGNIPDHGYDQPSVRPTPGSSGNSHPGYDNDKPHVPAPTAESHGNSEPEYSNDQPTVPQSTQGSHANYPDNKYSQPSAPGYVSPSQESNKNEPQPTGSEAATTTIPAYGPGAPVNPPASSAVHHGHVGNATTFAIWTTATEERHAPSASSSTPEEAPYTPVIASRASRHQGMVWTLIAGTLIALIN
ncbi:hypothetical protein EDB82DRAFT_549386 [Fusarium venenatum]|uniref:uncharacterized protein n=1 Tax=Fusarium venenatum TaxID=56646 RepID=UPI001DB96223|nr:hypothetical protein EDB82DRAFT_549386 [Fusarium venenatum]